MKKIIVLLVACLFMFFGCAEVPASVETTSGDVPTGEAEKICTVTFDSLGGSYVEQQAVVRGEKAVEPPAPTKECRCEFEGWYLGDEKWSFIGYTVTEDITLTAKYFECFGLNDAEREILEECVLSRDYTWHDVRDIQEYDTYDFSNQEAVEYTVIFKDGKTFTITIGKSYLK